ncbi:MAG: aldehyde dehydrogenase (NADP(+)) [Actinobacteria bacterium]|nr:aldehyde dehydrogenase (NADP(+)) [Actinomycetota bacterium]MBO0785571.1 aldehyde dehydrogenase (NADP(+)) [Actinomycetota bacterium]
MIQGYDPRTGQPAGEPVPETSGPEVSAIAAAAAAACEAWEQAGAAGRAAALEAVAAALDEAAAELVAVADTETALGEARLTGEVARTTGQLRLFAAVLADGGYADTVLSPGGDGAPDLRRISRPIGPVAVFAASNFPFAFSVAGNDTASALAAGCPVVVKAHEGHPRTSVLTARVVAGALARAGAPEGTFAVVYGVDAGVKLLQEPAIAAAGFTGSARGGLALAAICAQRPVPIPFFGELGSVNPVVILPGAAAARPGEIAAGYAASLTLGAGQFCTNPGLLFVPAGDRQLLDDIAGAVGGSTGGPMLSARIHDSYQSAVAELTARPDLAPLADGRPGEGPWAATPKAFEVSLGSFANGLPGLAAERFGPAGLVITYESLADLLPVLARLGGNLAGVVHADPDSAADMALARQVAGVFARTVGRVVFNGWPTGVAVTWAQHHGGPWPASTSPAFTSVGAAAIRRWLVPVAYQDFPPDLLPPGLRGETPG